MRFAIVNGLTFHYSIEGTIGGIPLVFINSLGTDFRIWKAMVPAFSEGCQILRYDKRGHGLSDCPTGPYTIRDHARDLIGLLDVLQFNRVNLVGISVGGMIALDIAATLPDRVNSLVLCDTGAIIGTPRYWDERIHSLKTQGLDLMAETIVSRWFVPDYPEQHPANYRGYVNMLKRTPLVGYIATCEAIRDADLRVAARSIETHTLVLSGSEDAATPPDVCQSLASLLKNARYDQLMGAAHLPCIEQPEAMSAKINKFYKEHVYD